ncbi:MAG: hypothetical protein KGO05_17150, partial [Chloroflexota bacterium]|nr:hypothetical protein [Chloroflexota bacterium]
VARWGIPLALRAAATPDAPGTEIIPSAVVWECARSGEWIVAARPRAGQPSGDVATAEVTAVWLPAWPLARADIPRRDLTVALASLPFGAIDARETADGARLVALAERADAITQALHSALRALQRKRPRVALGSRPAPLVTRA